MLKPIMEIAIITLRCPRCGDFLRNKAERGYSWLLEHLSKRPQIVSCQSCGAHIELPARPQTTDGTARVRFRKALRKFRS